MSRRCFVGVPLPETYQEGLRKVAEKWQPRLASRINWTKPGNWHITLYFLGEVEQGDLDRARQTLAEISHSRFSLRGGGGGFFPPQKKPPRVIWVGLLQGSQECVELADKVVSGLQRAGFPPRDKPYRPHLTLGRVKKGLRDDWNGLLKFLQDTSWPEVEVDSFVLWESRLSPQGPSYHPLERYNLG